MKAIVMKKEVLIDTESEQKYSVDTIKFDNVDNVQETDENYIITVGETTTTYAINSVTNIFVTM